MVQILRAPNAIADAVSLRSALGYAPWPRLVPDWLYKVAWTLYRVDTDFHLLSLLQRLSGLLHISKPLALSRVQQWALTVIGVVVAGAPFTPLAHGLDEAIVHLLHSSPWAAAGLMLSHFAVSVMTVRFIFVSVLTSQRFRRTFPQQLQVPVSSSVKKGH